MGHQVEEEKKQPPGQGRRAYRSIGSEGSIDPEKIKAQAIEIEKKMAGKAKAVPEYVKYKQMTTNIELVESEPAPALAMLMLYAQGQGFKVELDEEEYSVRIHLP